MLIAWINAGAADGKDGTSVTCQLRSDTRRGYREYEYHVRASSYAG